ncbi:hypothetical protein D9611_014584 [Ephemerocybe angulata]|uniref:Aldehyde dehydrogenase domain-containing protein n=1 Tax=Ephemerocybe angulata TaxID=980116 RepID=A0A8H5FF76_9AGAR|nr:hypothetical protein D9611_014584 [Tulosesus angulatus]
MSPSISRSFFSPISSLSQLSPCLYPFESILFDKAESTPPQIPIPLLPLHPDQALSHHLYRMPPPLPPLRQHQPFQLACLVQENADALCHSLWLDESKSSWGRSGLLVEGCSGARVGGGGGEKIGEDVQLEGQQEASKARVETKAKGVVLIISPWNYLIILTFQSLSGAIAAGCPALIKPSKVVPSL